MIARFALALLLTSCSDPVPACKPPEAPVSLIELRACPCPKGTTPHHFIDYMLEPYFICRTPAEIDDLTKEESP